MEIIKADINNLSGVARLFDLYRQYYSCQPDLPLATQFIKDRIESDESDIFIAIDGNSAAGFVQLYPSFCSVDACKIYILHDLYVDENYRGAGVGKRLMNRALLWAKENGAGRIDLLTEHTNHAQYLYEKLGYKKVLQDYHAYSLKITQDQIT